jgi:hypothetical protein
MHDLPPIPERPDPLSQQEIEHQLRQSITGSMRLFWGLIGTLSFLILTLLGAVGYLLVQNADTNTQTRQVTSAVRQGAIASCQAGNSARAANQKIWDDFLNLLITNPATPVEKAALLQKLAPLSLSPAERTAMNDLVTALLTNNPAAVQIVQQFEGYIAAHEKTQDCSKIYGSS